MADETDDSYTVDFRLIGVTAPEDGVSRIQIRGKEFTREIFKPLQGHEEITSQTNYNHTEDYLYRFNQPLPQNAMESQQTLTQALIAHAPAARAYLAQTSPYSFGPRMMTWEALSQELVTSVPDNCFGTPCLIQAEEIFGVTRVRTQVNHWITRYLGAVPIVPDMWCAICRTDVTDAPAEELTGLNVCGHVFHKACLYPSMGNMDFNTVLCPVCARPLA